MKSKVDRKKPVPTLTNLTGITRNADRCETRVRIHMDWDTRIDWLVFGQAQIRHRSSEHDGRWRLEARMGFGATDQEEDSAYALRLPIVGLQIGPMAVNYHTTHFIAWVDADGMDDFHVPIPGYNPISHPDTTKCTSKGCEPKGHPILPEGFYVPPFEEDLYRMVAGQRIEIFIGTVVEED